MPSATPRAPTYREKLPTYAELREALRATHTSLELILEIPRLPRRARAGIEREAAAARRRTSAAAAIVRGRACG